MAKNFCNNSALLLLPISSSASTKITVSVFGSLLHRKMASYFKLEEIDTEIGLCFPIELVALVTFSSLDGTQIDSKSNPANF